MRTIDEPAGDGAGKGRSRRGLLRTIGAAGIAGVAGCTRSGRRAMGEGDSAAGGTERTRNDGDSASSQTPTPRWGDADGTAMYRVDLGNTGATDDERGPVADVEAKWTTSIGSVSNTTPAVSKGTVFVEDGNGLRPFGTNAATPGGMGMGEASTGSTPTVREDRVYIGGNTSYQLLVLQRDPMIQGWHFPTGGALTSPAVVDDTVYVGCEDRHVYAVSPPASTDEYQPEGTEEWAFEIDADRAPAAGGTWVSSPAVVDGTVYVNTFERCYALDAADGSVVWSSNAGNGTPVVADDTLYLASSDSVQALSVADGSERWRSDVGGFESAAVTQSGVFVAKGSLHKLDPADGSIVWEVTPEEQGTERFQYLGATAPVVASGTVYVGFPNAMYAVDAANGSVHWTYETAETVVQTPAVADGELYFTGSANATGEAGGTLHALREP